MNTMNTMKRERLFAQFIAVGLFTSLVSVLALSPGTVFAMDATEYEAEPDEIELDDLQPTKKSKCKVSDPEGSDEEAGAERDSEDDSSDEEDEAHEMSVARCCGLVAWHCLCWPVKNPIRWIVPLGYTIGLTHLWITFYAIRQHQHTH